MVLNETNKKWLSIVGGAAFIIAQASFMILGIADLSKPSYEVETLIITDECMEYIQQNPIQRLPDNKCVRQIKYLQYRIILILREVENVD